MTQEKLSKPCFALMGVAGFIAPRHLEAINPMIARYWQQWIQTIQLEF